MRTKLHVLILLASIGFFSENCFCQDTFVIDSITYQVTNEIGASKLFGTVMVIKSQIGEYHGTVVIPNAITVDTSGYKETYKVTAIDKEAFIDSYDLNKVVLSPSIEKIGYWAFRGCENLDSIIIPYGNLETIPNSCFAGSGIKAMIIPSSVKAIDWFAFDGCEQLESILLPNTIKSIGTGAFRGCKSLRQIKIPQNVKEIGSQVFQESGIESCTIPEGLREIGENAFNSCGHLNAVTLPNSLRKIGDYAFCGCPLLKSIELPKSLRVIGEGSFSRSGLNSCILPYGIKTMPALLFEGCKSLSSVVIPNTVSAIEESAFEGCIFLTEIELPPSIQTISKSLFRKCSSLSQIIIPINVTTIQESAFENTSLEKIQIPGSVQIVEKNAFRNCYSLTEVQIHSSTKIGDVLIDDRIASVEKIEIIGLPHGDFDEYLKHSIGIRKSNQLKNLKKVVVHLSKDQHFESEFAQIDAIYDL